MRYVDDMLMFEAGVQKRALASIISSWNKVLLKVNREDKVDQVRYVKFW